MPPELIPSDEEYASEEDSDFAPDAVPAQEDAESESESEHEAVEAVAKPKKRKRGEDEEAEDLGIENSGDEAIIETGLKSRRKKAKKAKSKGKDVEEEDEGGDGGMIKTRSMRAQEKVEKKKGPLATTDASTIDVDAVWQAMISGKPAPVPSSEPKPTTESANILSLKSPITNRVNFGARKDSRSPSTLGDGPDSMIMIKRTYNFAGKVHIEQKLVPRNSAEAKLYLASQPTVPPPTEPEPAPSLFTKPKRPTKKARRSIFEPVIENLVKRTDLHFGERKESDVVLSEVGTGKEKKLNTVEKSAMDWAGYVDKEGIKDELDAAGKSKGAYKARQEFLARVEAKKVEDERRARGLPPVL